jgi:hypothetical protein
MKVDHENGIIEFKSLPVFFAKERAGHKCCTFRSLDVAEYDELWKMYEAHEKPRIRITCNCDSFERIITDISTVGNIAGHDLHIISWADKRLELCEGIEAENIKLKAEIEKLNATLKDYGDSAERGGWQ